MVNWKTYIITDIQAPMKSDNSRGSFSLSDYVNYEEKNVNYIWCVNTYPYNTFKIGDRIEIDNDKTKYYDCYHNFNDFSAVRKAGSGENELLRSRISELESKARNLESSSSTQLVLRRNAENSLSTVQSERNNLQVSKRNLESRVSDLQSNNSNLSSENYRLGELIRSGERELTTKNNQIAAKDRQINSYSTQLTTAQNQLTTVRNELTTSRNEYKDLMQQFTELQITANNKDNEISSLRENLGSSQNIEVRYKEKKLDELIRSSGLDQNRVMNLRDAYESLKRAYEDYNQNDISNANGEIETIKREFFQTNVSIDDLHKIYRICEKIAELKVKQEKLRDQQHEARQEAPPRNN